MKSLNPKEVKNRIVFLPVSLFRPEDKPGIVSLFLPLSLLSCEKGQFKAILTVEYNKTGRNESFRAKRMSKIVSFFRRQHFFAL
jgi:hypothetical protein